MTGPPDRPGRLVVTADPAVCCASGRCAATEPAVFGQDPHSGTVVVLDPAPVAELAESVRLCADLCPCAAITVSGAP